MKPDFRRLQLILPLILGVAVAGCAAQPPEQAARGEIFDPYESANRSVHAFNRGVDRVFFRPAAKGYTTIVPPPIVDSVGYFADNLSKPGDILNHLAQGNLKDAGWATARFLMNSTIGFAGLADPATEFGIPDAYTDFGETLHVWGFGEGAYIELPFFGPSTQRDAIGTVADFFTNPLTFSVEMPADNISVYAKVLQRLGDRGRYADTVDSILYDSADSYAQGRVIYLQNRRFELGADSGAGYLDAYADPYEDLYEDPYAE